MDRMGNIEEENKENKENKEKQNKNTQELPIKLFLGKLDNVSKNDAKNYCRSLISKYFDDKENCYFAIKKHNTDVFYEVQEGGNKKSYLSSVVKFVQNQNIPYNELIFPSGTKNVKVKKIEDGVYFEILSDKDEDNKVIEITEERKRTGTMTPYQSDKNGLLMFSAFVMIMGFSLVVTSYVLYFTKASVTTEKKLKSNFSSLQERLEDIKEIDNDEFVDKLYFENNKWKLITKKKENI